MSYVDRFFKTYSRSLRLRCPRCGKGKLFRKLFYMLHECPDCELIYEREQGFYLGAIYVSYGITAVITTIGYLVMFLGRITSDFNAKVICTTFAIVFPLLIFRHARSIWLGFDFIIDPRPLENKDEIGSNSG